MTQLWLIHSLPTVIFPYFTISQGMWGKRRIQWYRVLLLQV